MVYIAYVILAAIVVFVSIKCANYVDLIDKKTNLSGAFIGGVILAAVTSLPELFTSITAITVVKNPGLVMGNVLGSNIFNISILAVLVFIFMKSFVASKIAKSHKITLSCTLLVYTILTVVVTFKVDYELFGISFASVLILIIYLVSLKYLAGDDVQNEEADTSTLTVKQIVVRFIISAIVLVAASILITYVTDIISDKLNLNASLAGALFLGVATSLPELSSSITLCRKKNFNAMVGNIIGSNMFNYLILLISDIMYNTESIYTATAGKQTNALILFGFVSSVFTGLLLVAKDKQKPKKALLYGCSGVVIVCYIAFLIVSA